MLQIPTNTNSRYRPEIDGLRAVAIVPVLLFHAGVSQFSGGYIGVDVFFVISGYLISTLILTELDNGHFSFAEFWIRRARRILPALFIVVVASLVAGWFLFFPNDFKDLGRTALSQSFFSSNIYFWLKSGYFAAPSETKPLLHTWSLSVEEQYYLVIPLFLFVVTKYVSKHCKFIVIGLAILSFSMSVWSSFVYPDAAFYLPHSRAWELLIGTWLAMSVINSARQPASTEIVREVVCYIGAFLIAVACFTFDQRTPFPGVAALAPCLGTAAIIWSNTGKRTSLGKMLARRWVVSIGLISYSLYLWHWPLLAFARYRATEELSLNATLWLVLASVPLAWLSYRYVETPFRRSTILRRRVVIAPIAVSALVMLFLVGAWINKTNGATGRDGFQSNTFAGDVTRPGKRERMCRPILIDEVPDDLLCRVGDIRNTQGKMLLIGDSFLEMYLEQFATLSSDYNQEVWFIRRQNVLIYPAIMQALDAVDVSQVVLIYSWNKANSNGIPEIAPNDVSRPRWVERFVEQRGFDPFQTFGNTRARFKSDLDQLTIELQRRNIVVSIVDSPPIYSVSVPLKLGIMAKNAQDPSKYGSLLSNHNQQQRHIYDVFDELGTQSVQIIKVTDVICDQSGFCQTYQNGHSLYSDNAHLSAFGAALTLPLIRRIFSAAPALRSN